MYYLFLLANAPDAWDSPHTQDDDGVYDDWGVYTQALQDAGILVEGAGLQAPPPPQPPSASATRSGSSRTVPSWRPRSTSSATT